MEPGTQGAILTSIVNLEEGSDNFERNDGLDEIDDFDEDSQDDEHENVYIRTEARETQVNVGPRHPSTVNTITILNQHQAPSAQLHMVGYILSDAQPTGPLLMYHINRIRQLEGFQPSPSASQPNYEPPIYPQPPIHASMNTNYWGYSMLCAFLCSPLLGVSYIVSIALSIHVVLTGRISNPKDRQQVLTCSFIEILSSVLVATLFWGRSYDQYFGWIFILMFCGTVACCGIPRIMKCWIVLRDGIDYAERLSIQNENELHARSIWSFSLGIFVLPHFVSIGYAFVFLKKGMLRNHVSTIIAFAILELTAWIVAVSLCWLTSNALGKETYRDGCYRDDSDQCANHYYGWIGILIWFLTYLTLGAARVIMMNKQPRQLRA